MSDSSALLAEAVRRLAAAGVGNPRLDARLLLEFAKGDGALFESFVVRRAVLTPIGATIP